MARILFIGDPHLKITRFDLAMRFLDWLDALIAEQKPDMVVNLGDTFDTHSVLRSEVMVEFMKHVYRTIDQKIEYVYLLGNHDMYKPNDSKYHAMLPYKDKIPGLVVIDETRDYKGMTFVPYQHDGANFPQETLSVCVAHQTFVGADYGSAIRTKEGVDASRIKGCDIIVSGHIHKRANHIQPVLYVGSPFSQNASDVDQVKGISILDTETLKVTFHETPLPMWRSMQWEITEGLSADVLHEELSRETEGSRDHWVLNLAGPKAEVLGYVNSIEFKKLIGKVDIKVKPTFTDKEKRQVRIEAKSMDHIVSEYVVKVYSGSIAKDKLIEAAKTVLSEANLSK